MAKYENVYEFMDSLDRIMPRIVAGLMVTALLALSAAVYLIYLLLDFIWEHTLV